MATVREVAGRYVVTRIGSWRVRLVLVKNPAGWLEALDCLGPSAAALVVINAREADGRDVSWVWDLQVGELRARPVAVAGDRAADLGLRLSYGEVPHATASDPLRALEHLPAGEVDVFANYTAFLPRAAPAPRRPPRPRGRYGPARAGSRRGATRPRPASPARPRPGTWRGCRRCVRRGPGVVLAGCGAVTRFPSRATVVNVLPCKCMVVGLLGGAVDHQDPLAAGDRGLRRLRPGPCRSW